MYTTEDMAKGIAKYLGISSNPHLVNCLDMVPIKYLSAIYTMICSHERHRMQKTIIAFHVSEDVGHIVEGCADKVEFCGQYMSSIV